MAYDLRAPLERLHFGGAAAMPGVIAGAMLVFIPSWVSS